MNQEQVKNHWKQMRGELRSWWSKITDDDLNRIGGQKDQLVSLVQQKYGYARDKAQQEVERRLREYSKKVSSSGGSGLSSITNSIEDKTGEIPDTSNMRTKLQESGTTGASKTDVLWENAPQITTALAAFVGFSLGYLMARWTSK